MVYTVKQLSDLAGVSVRTLHYYDEIDLLNPSWVGDNGYRYYEDDAVFHLQQILFFRELDLSLEEIKEIMEMPTFDMLPALEAHRGGLKSRISRLQKLIETIDSTILHLTGEMEMSEKQVFSGFSEEEERRYAKEARELYGAEAVNASYKRWNSYTERQKEAIKAEGGAIYMDLVAVMDNGAASPEVQQVIGRWRENIRHFYEPSPARIRGLGQLYNDHPDFARNMRQFHPQLPEFLREAINIYCDRLEAG